MLIIGERLNSTRPPVREALANKDRDFLVREARQQKDAGAEYLDLNTAALVNGEIEALRWAVPILREEIGVPLAIDTPSPEAMEVGLRLHKGQAILNSLSAEESRIRQTLPIIREHSPIVVILCLDDDGLPPTAERELAIAEKMVDLLAKEGVPPERILIDPLVRPVAVSECAARLFLDSLRLIKRHLPQVRTIAGASNVSFGLPGRSKLNRTFLALAMAEGLDAAILDPLDHGMRASVASADALLGHDPALRRYLAMMRKRKPPVYRR